MQPSLRADQIRTFNRKLGVTTAPPPQPSQAIASAQQLQLEQKLLKTGRQLLGRRLLDGRLRVPSALAKVAAAAKMADPVAEGSNLQQYALLLKRAYYPNQGGWYIPPGDGAGDHPAPGTECRTGGNKRPRII
jgi:hypothetical protein